MTIDWTRALEFATLPEWRLEQAELLRQHAQQNAHEATASEQATDPPHAPTPVAKTRALAPTAAARDPRPTPTCLNPSMSVPPLQRAPEPVEVLNAALEAATDDQQRAALLAAAPREVRERFSARLRYHAFLRSVDDDPYTAFERALDAAADDNARRALITAKDAAFLSEWSWRVRASAEDWRRRYLDFMDSEQLCP